MKRLKDFGLLLVAIIVLFGNLEIVDAASTLELNGYKAYGIKFGSGEKYVRGSATEADKRLYSGVSYNGKSGKFSVASMGDTLHVGSKKYGKGGTDIAYYWHQLNTPQGWKDAYCLDAQLPSKTKVYAARFAYYTQEDLKKITPGGNTQQELYSQDIAFAYVMNQSGGYFEKSLALRFLGVIFGTLSYASTNNIGNNIYNNFSTYQYKGFIGTVVKMMDANEDGVKDNVQIIHDKVVELTGVSWAYPVSTYRTGYNSGIYWSGPTVDKAKALFKAAIKEAADFYKGVTTAPSDVKVEVDGGGKPSASTVVETEDANGTLISQEKEHEIVITGLDKITDPFFKFTGLTVDYDAVTIEASSISVNDSEKCSTGDACKTYIDSKTNVLEGVTITETTKIKIKVKISGYKYVKEGSGKTKLDCDKLPVDYHINYEAKTGNGSGEGGSEGTTYDGDNRMFVVWYNLNESQKGYCDSTNPETNYLCADAPGSAYQRFLTDAGTVTHGDPGTDPGDDDADDVTKGTIDDSMPLLEKCDECEDLRVKCQGEDSAACNDYLKNCDKCETYPVMCGMGIAVYCDEMKKPEYKAECPLDETCTALQAACITKGDMSSDECKKYKDFVRDEYPEGCGDCTTWDKLCDPMGDSDACDKYKDPANSCEKCDEWETECLAGDDDACKKFEEAKCPEDDCDKLKQLCDKLPDSDYCKKYDEECDRSKIECGTEVTELMECCEDGGGEKKMSIDDMFEFEGMMPDPYKISGVIEDNIKMCFVDNVAARKDPVDDSRIKYPYALTPESGTMKSGKTDFEDNKYCKVNCREDYAFLFPNAKRVNAGRYFTFQVKLQDANKQCFTSKIDKEEYIKDVNGILQRIEKSFNDYQRYKKAEESVVTKGKGEYVTGCTPSDADLSCGTTTSTIEIGATTGNYSAPQVKFNINTSRGEITSITNIPSVSFSASEGDTPQKDCASYNKPTGEKDPVTGEDVTEPVDCGKYYDATNEYTAEKLKGEMKVLKETAEAAYNAAKQELEDTINLYADCTSWQTKYELEPKVQYNYAESDPLTTPKGYYYDKLNAEGINVPIDMDTVGSISTSDEEQYCITDWNNKSADVDSTYKNGVGCTFGGNETEKLKYDNCDLITGTCDTREVEVSKAAFKKQLFKLDSEVTYKPQTIFYNIYPTGEIEVGNKGKNSTGINGEKNSVALEEELSGEMFGDLAVPLNATRGVYKYNILVTDLGEYYGDKGGKTAGTKGRFSGAGDDSVISAKTGKDNLDFVCAYLVNIPEQAMECDFNQCTGKDCTSKCLGSHCEDEDFECDDIKCVTQCVGVGCIYDTNTGSSLLQKTVTLNKLFPNGTEAYNWDEGANTKAQETIKEIEDTANGIYDTDPVLSITINPSQATKIKEYNKSVLSDGSYSNKTMYCKNSSDGAYELIHCYSKFLDDYIFSGSTMGTVNSKSTALSNRNDIASYFKTWTGAISEEYMVGPAWK